MSTLELKKKLIDKIQKTDNDPLLEEVYRMLELGSEDTEVYILNDEQKRAIQEARHQFQNGQFLTNDQASEEIDKWLNK